MTSPNIKSQPKVWTKGPYQISTDTFLIPVVTLNSWFASDELYWARPMPEPALRETLQNSLCFGLYHGPRQSQADEKAREPNTNAPEFIGFARCITDSTTFIYLTDVFILPSHQGSGLGTWLVKCVQEVIESMPYLRRSLLFTGDWKRSVPFYEKFMGMKVLECRPPVDGQKGQGTAVMMRKWKGVPGFEGDT
ncbi:Acyl-CoA N-acyltransferase [Penicillium lagena]|uniref:Acyl-CoA N-acyltransferase n=1 Tax=Penicillium lagena TaxID=94218 RepID=UPI00253F995C|nr:Acyl-CoA N-acyltransferase [Penicillium lagena]KAJ5625972.1 Acyl-CoA N-acyltransferase [Penicillium lagena]